MTSVDNPTTGRQIATMIQSSINKEELEKIHYPVGTKVIFNKRDVNKIGINFSDNIAFIANEIIE